MGFIASEEAITLVSGVSSHSTLELDSSSSESSTYYRLVSSYLHPSPSLAFLTSLISPTRPSYRLYPLTVYTSITSNFGPFCYLDSVTCVLDFIILFIGTSRVVKRPYDLIQIDIITYPASVFPTKSSEVETTME